MLSVSSSPGVCRVVGSYEALAGGQTGDALVDFTGGVNEAIDVREGGYDRDEDKKVELFEVGHGGVWEGGRERGREREGKEGGDSEGKEGRIVRGERVG